MKTIKGKKGFTLVELIIVITILSILSTIAFVSFQSYIKDARDANRLSTLNNIEKGLDIYSIKVGSFPLPDSKFEITASGNTIGFQGVFGDIGSRAINMNNTPVDPKTKGNYIYQINKNSGAYQIMTFMENNSYPFTKGKDLGLLLSQDNDFVLLDSGKVDLMNFGSGTDYKVYLGNTVVEGKGIEIFGGLEMLGEKNGSVSPPSKCKEGFIPVGGNPEFLQPGFCVMKYEANHKTIDSNTDPSCTSATETWECNIDGSSLISTDLSSRPGALPINKVSQQKAIDLCIGLGSKHHLVTNNEWMTIARQIEKNSNNWNNGQVGSGGVYRGNVINTNGSDDQLSCGSGIASLTDFTDLDSPNLINIRNTCEEKRQLILANGEIIWDFSGNLWEHVNKANTIDGRLFDSGLTTFVDNASWDGDGWYPSGYNSSDMASEIRKKYGPSNSSYGNNHGMGNIRGWQGATSNVFVRGEGGWGLDQGGIYTLGLRWSNGDSNDSSFGFRCAY